MGNPWINSSVGAHGRALAVALEEGLLRLSSSISEQYGYPRGVNFSTTVILSAAKDLRSAQREILRCAQDDSWRAIPA